MLPYRWLTYLLLCVAVVQTNITSGNQAQWKVGIAKQVITPEEPMWMSGYGSRNRPADGKISDLWAKVLTIQDASGNRVILITLDLIGIDAATTSKIRSAINEQTGIPAGSIAITTTHTHSGPVVGQNLQSMYQLQHEEWKQIQRYTNTLTKTVVELVKTSIRDSYPSELQWTVGRTTFAVNRRNNPEQEVPKLASENRLSGPVDHDLPILTVLEPIREGQDEATPSSDEKSRLRAIVCGYACHATVLSGYQWCADWPGFAQSSIETRFPGVTAMVWVGCGADQNPIPRRSIELAQQYGQQIDEATALAISKPMNSINGPLQTNLNEILLNFSDIPSRDELEETLKSSNRFEVSRAQNLLQQWDETGSIRSDYAYPIQSWKLGDGPLWFFLGGEVVIDYALRIKQELGAGKTWIAAYSNDVMAYIPSERVLREGGYEGGGSMLYYGLPSPWKTGIESAIIQEVRIQAEKLTGIKRSELRTISAPDYPNHDDLTVWQNQDGKRLPIENPEHWETRRNHILQAMQEVMGRLPTQDELEPLNVKILKTESFDGYERQTISYSVDSFADATAHLYLPHKGLKQSNGKIPAVLALHPTSVLGKRIVAGEGPRPNRNYGQELAKRGYVVLAPDYPSFGDQQTYNFATDSYLSGTMKAIVNHQRGIDVLTKMTEVDSDRIGAIGHSLGGHNAIFIGAFDKRVRCVISSCGWDPFPFYYGGKLAGWSSQRYMPRIREVYGLDPKKMPFDFPETIAAIAPRAFFSCSPLKDSNFDAEGVKQAEPAIRSVYETLDAGDQMVIRYPDAGHDFPTEVRNEAYDFLDRALSVKN